MKAYDISDAQVVGPQVPGQLPLSHVAGRFRVNMSNDNETAVSDV